MNSGSFLPTLFAFRLVSGRLAVGPKIFLFSFIINERVSRTTANFVAVNADVVSLQCLTVWGSVLCSSTSTSCDVLHLVSRESFVEVGKTPE